ncbi:hypothetical protein N665_0660s0001 [Sinapis alba]|nr:hypothetical protein N665_0660s0001 [Sinapis alba]
MVMLSWNCQGLGRAQDLVIPRLREIRKEYFTDILFLMETKQSRDSLVDLQAWLGYNRILTVNPIGYNGGLALMWKNSNLVDCNVKFGKDSFFVSCVYGDPVRENKAKVWERLSRIGVHRNEPWCMLGDFNEIRHNGEKTGGGPRRSEASLQPFNDMLDTGELVELPSCGNNLTWGGSSWKLLASNQVFMDKRGSDHRPVLVKLISSSDPFCGSFQFDRRFTNKPGVKEEIKKVWLTNHPLFEAKFYDRLKKCRKALSNWKKRENINSREKIKQIQCAMELEKSSSFPSGVRVNYLKAELIKAYKEEELYWKQKCKEQWAVKGDLNTKYYHESVKSSRAKKRIIKLMDENNQEQFSEAAKAEVANKYFMNLFKSSSEGEFNQLFDGFSSRIISKIIVSRLKPLLPDLVSPTQSAFVEERLITDNILISHEMIHALKTNDRVAKAFIAIKSDMSKAYDRVEWGYLRALLFALGFNEV